MKLHKIIIAFLTVLFLVLSINLAHAENARISAIISLNMEPYKETLTGFQQYLRNQGVEADFIVYPLDGDAAQATMAVQEVKNSRFDLIFALGTVATDAALERIKDIPIVAGLILRADKLKNAGNATGVFLEFPLNTQFEMLRRFLPEAKTIGVIYNPGENKEIIDAAFVISQKMGFRLDAQKVYVPQDLPAALDALSNSADVLWGVSDNLVLTSQTARHILLFSYRNHIPFIGLSATWVKAGALYSLDRDYTDIGRQCGEIAFKILQGSRTNLIPPAPPRKIIYSINLKTARDMKIEFSDMLVSGAYEVF